MIEFKDYRLDDEVSIGPYKFEVEVSVYRNYFLRGLRCNGHEIFKYLRVDKLSYVKNIVGHALDAGFPEVQTLEDLNKVIRQLQIDYLIKKVKEKYPVGVVFKSIFNKFDYTSSGRFEWIHENKVIRDVEVYGVVWHDNKWAEIITEELGQSEINTYGLKVGDVLKKDVISAWAKQGPNRYQSGENSGEWSKGGNYVCNEKIVSFGEFHGVVGFLVSGTNEVYLKAEGFKEFAESFDKPKFEVGKWYKSNVASTNYDKFYYLKVLEVKSGYPRGQAINIFNSKNYVYNKEHRWIAQKTIEQALSIGPLTDLSEIQEYLPEGHPDKINQNNLIPGKWYKVEGFCEYIAKLVGIEDGYFLTPGYYIQDGKYILSLKYNNRLIDISDKVFTEVPIEEVQQYLPDGHPDKIKTDSEYIVGKWYKMGEWIAKFSELKGDKFWCSMSGTPNDNYKHFGSEVLSIRIHGIPKLITDMTEVYKLFPEEKPKESEFEVNDWVVVESWHYAKIPLPQTCQISRINSEDEAPYEILLNEDYYGRDCSWNFKKGEFRYATSEEVDREIERRQLIKGESPRITQIVKSVVGEEEKHPFKPLKKSDLEWEIISPEVKMLLSIDDEELPMVSISKTKTVKQLLNND